MSPVLISESLRRSFRQKHFFEESFHIYWSKFVCQNPPIPNNKSKCWNNSQFTQTQRKSFMRFSLGEKWSSVANIATLHLFLLLMNSGCIWWLDGIFFLSKDSNVFEWTSAGFHSAMIKCGELTGNKSPLNIKKVLFQPLSNSLRHTLVEVSLKELTLET